MMNWKKLGASLLAGIACCGAAFAGLEAYVPDDMPLVMQINVPVAVKTLDANLAKCPKDFQADYLDLRARCEKMNLEHSRLFNRVFVAANGEDTVLGLCETNVAENQLAELAMAFADTPEEGQMPPSEMKDGRKFYLLDDRDEEEKAANSQENVVAFTYLAPNVVAFVAWTDAGRAILKAPCGKNPQMEKLADNKLFSAAFVVPEAVRAALNQPDANGKKGLAAPKCGDFWVNMVGSEKADLEFELNVDAVNKSERDQTAAMLGMYLPMLGMAFGEDPELGMAVVKAIKIEPKGDQSIRVSADLPEALLKKIFEYVQQQEKAQAEADAEASQTK